MVNTTLHGFKTKGRNTPRVGIEYVKSTHHTEL